jgi:hypothetical protein
LSGAQQSLSTAQVEMLHGAPHTLGVPPPPQLAGAAQEPQLRTLPQPSPSWPQLIPREAQVAGVQALPHTLAVPPPPQVWGEVQLPQVIVPPQPS